MNVKEILKNHGFNENMTIKQVRIENGKRKYVVKDDNDKYFLLDENSKNEIDYTEKITTTPEKPKKKTTTKKK